MLLSTIDALTFVQVKHISSLAMPEDDTWCWNENFIDLDVGTQDMTGIVFVQRGYWINLISSHDTDAYILLPDSSRLDITIKVSCMSCHNKNTQITRV